MITAAKLRVEVGAETREAEAGLGRVSKGMTQLAGVGQVALGTVLGGVVMQAGRQLVGLGGEALGAFASFERMGMSLQQLAAKERLNAGAASTMEEALAQTKDTAKELQGWIQKLAIESPFTQSGVADAFKMAMAYGFTTNEAKRLTQAMIDFAAGSGASESTMGRIALALGQIQAKGKIAGQEVLQLTEAGIAVDAILAKAFGKTTAEIVEMREKGLIPANEAVEAIVQSLESDFGGAAARQTETISGLVSSLEDIKEIGLREFFGGVFREFQPDLNAFVGKLQEPDTIEAIRSWGIELAKFTREVVTSGGEVIRWFSDLEQGTQGLVVALGLIAINAGTAIKLMTGLYTVAVGLPGVIGAISTAWAAWNAGLTLTTALGVAGIAPIAITLGAITLAVGSVVAVWATWNEQITKTNREGVEGVASALGTELEKVRTAGGDAIEVTDTFIEKQKIIDDQLKKSGVAGWFIDRAGMAKSNLAELSDVLEKTGAGYDDYIDQMKRAADATGLKVVVTEDGIRVYKQMRTGLIDLTDEIGIQSRAQYDASQATDNTTNSYYQLTQAQRDMFSGSGAVVGALEDQGEAAQNTADRIKDLAEGLKTIVAGQFGKETENFKEQQDKIRGEIEETKQKLAELGVPEFMSPEAAAQVDALNGKLQGVNNTMFNLAENAGIDWKTLAGTNDLSTLDIPEDVIQQIQDLRGESYTLYGQIKDLGGVPYATDAQKEDIEGMRERLGELQTELDETATAHEEAMRRMAFNMLMERASSDGMTQNELNNLTKIAHQWGLYDQKTADVVYAINNNLGELDTENPGHLLGVLEGIMDLPSNKDFTYTVSTVYVGQQPGEGDGATSRAGADADLAESLTSTAKIGVQAMEEVKTSIGDTRTAFEQTGQVATQKVQEIGNAFPPVDAQIDITLAKLRELKEVWYSINSRFLRFEVDVSIDPDFGLLAGLGGLKGRGGEDEDLLPGRASGGPVNRGVPYLVGERGTEIFIPEQNGQILNAQQTNQALAGQSDKGSVTIYFAPGSIVGAPGQSTEELAFAVADVIQNRML